MRPRAFCRREQFADRIEGLEIGDRVGSGRASDRCLVHQDDICDVFESLQLAKRADPPVPVALRALDGRVQHVVDERRLAGTADAGDAGQRIQRDVDIDVLQVVLGGALETNLVRQPLAPRRRHRNRELVPKIFRGQGSRLEQQSLVVARVDDLAALLAGTEADIDDVIGHANHVLVVLDDEHGVALIAKLLEDVDEAPVVARVQTD